MSKPTILLVDDDKNILEGYQRKLSFSYVVETANSAKEALGFIVEGKGYDIVISDQCMPEMTGVEFLKKLKVMAPDTFRIMLSGESDIYEAVEAINEGAIFRFLLKPCKFEVLEGTISEALSLKRLMNIEKELLENTLKGSVDIMSEILSLTSPLAYGKSKRVAQIIDLMCAESKFLFSNELKLAASLSQIACVTIPLEVLEKAYRDEELSPDEMQMMKALPAIGDALIGKIPRMENVGFFIKNQGTPLCRLEIEKPFTASLAFGCQLLKLAFELDEHMTFSELAPSEVIANLAALYKGEGVYPEEALDLLLKVSKKVQKQKVKITEVNKPQDIPLLR